jgi:hypothetical protein
VEGIRQRFARLNTYATILGSILKLEAVNLGAEGRQRKVWCLAISAKRYCLYTLDDAGEAQLVKWSEDGLGHLLNLTDPDSDDRDWMSRVWEGIVREALRLSVADPAWVDRPALSRLTVSCPELLKPFAALNAGKSYPDQVKPFSFLLVGHVRPFGYPEGVNPARFQLVAPYESDATKWLRLPWTDRYSGRRIPASTTKEMDGPERRGCRPTATWCGNSAPTQKRRAPMPRDGLAGGRRSGCSSDGSCRRPAWRMSARRRTSSLKWRQGSS